MGFSNKLCNATPWEQKIPWHRSKIIIPGDGSVNLSADQSDDFRPEKPGAEEVRRMMENYGCFVYDADKSYDVQMYEALRKTVAAKNQRYNDFVTSLRNDRIRAGQTVTSEDELESVINLQGYGELRKQIETLTKRIEKLRTILTKTGELDQNRSTPKYDMERTCFGTSPPREFPSTLALELFLEENAEVAEKHDKFMNAFKSSKSTGVSNTSSAKSVVQ